MLLVAGVVFLEAVAAINRTVIARTERNLGFYATRRASYVEHFALLTGTAAETTTVVLLFASSAALGATARLIGEAFLSIKFLLGCGEYELYAAIAASQVFVFHV